MVLGALVAEAERRKQLEYSHLSTSFLFIPLAFVIPGAIGSESLVYLMHCFFSSKAENVSRAMLEL